MMLSGKQWLTNVWDVLGGIAQEAFEVPEHDFLTLSEGKVIKENVILILILIYLTVSMLAH